MLIKIKRKLAYKYYYLIDPLYKILPQKQNESVFIIFSEARSGTTWLAEVLKAGLHAAMVWEPLHPQRGLISAKYGRRPQWKPENKEELKKELGKIFSGLGINSWTSRMEKNPIPFYTASKPLLIKFTRVNKLLPELFDYFEFKHKPVLLVRHPAAVFLSQFTTFGNPNEGFYFTNQKRNEVLEDPLYIEHQTFIDQQEKLLYKEFAVYCMNNYHIYNTEVNSDEYHVLFYEELLLNPMEALQPVLKDWGLNPQRLHEKLNANTTKKETKQRDFSKHQQLSKWKNQLTEIDHSIFQTILEYFQIQLYTMHEGMPFKYTSA